MVNTKSVVLIFISVAVLVIASAVIELKQSKEELLDLMKDQTHTLLETIIKSSKNTLLSNEAVNKEIQKRLLNNAYYIKMFYENGTLNNSIIRKIAQENNLFRINVINRDGQLIYSNNPRFSGGRGKNSPQREKLLDIFNGKKDTVIMGVKEARFSDEFRFAIAIAAEDRSAIVVNLNAQQLIQFKEQISLSGLFNNVIKNDDLIYIAFQDTSGILGGSGNIDNLDDLNSVESLKESLRDSVYTWRQYLHDSTEVFEAAHPFSFGGINVGLIRLGLSLEPINSLNQRIVRRVIIIGIVLFLLGSIVISYVFVRQNFNVLQKRVRALESYSKKILENINEAVIMTDKNFNVISVNKATLDLFDVSLLKTVKDLFTGSEIKKISGSQTYLFELNKNISGSLKTLLISKSTFTDENETLSLILVIKDLTDQKKFEEKLKRKEHLVAMGELASGVAHEIRNPINTIGTIAQQLNKDFIPETNKDDYASLTSLVYKEVKRINNTIEEFLKFARPNPLKPSNFNLTELINQLKTQVNASLSEKSIVFEISGNVDIEVNWDKNQIYQVFLNLIQNSIDSIDKGGKIKILSSTKDKSNITLVFSDNGKGINSEILPKIFNLYFTTKAKGTGIGLSIVQRIIYEHGGTIEVESELNRGTKIILTLPVTFITN
ncbi:nitrogen regulation protein NR(II) [Bacteroidota bacterium]